MNENSKRRDQLNLIRLLITDRTIHDMFIYILNTFEVSCRWPRRVYRDTIVLIQLTDREHHRVPFMMIHTVCVQLLL